jgi:hypothetical protein
MLVFSAAPALLLKYSISLLTFDAFFIIILMLHLKLAGAGGIVHSASE